MRILAFIYSFPPDFGGSSLGMYDLLKRLAKNNQITVVTCKHSNIPSIGRISGMKVIRLSKFQVAGIYPIPRPTPRNFGLLKLVCDKEHDLIYTRTRFFFTSLLGLLISILKKKPMLHTEPGTGFINYNKWWINLAAKTWDYTIGRIILRRATSIGVSKAASEFSERLGHKATKTIYNGIDKEIFYAK